MKCNICNNTHHNLLFTKNLFRVVQCKKCQTVFIATPPTTDNLKRIYNKDFFFDNQKHSATKLYNRSAPVLNAKQRLRLILKYKASGSLLDVGCSTGIFINEAKKYFSVLGLDISPEAVQIAQSEYHVNARHGLLPNVNYNNKFDVITMFDTLEHVTNPYDYLSKIYSQLNFNGIFVFTTPDTNSLMYKINKKNWHLMIPPKHLFLFSSKTINPILTKVGFHSIKILKKGQYLNLFYAFNKISRTTKSKAVKKICQYLARRTYFQSALIQLNLKDVMTVICYK